MFYLIFKNKFRLMKILSTNYGKLHYQSIGKGPNHVLLFHGFGQDHRDMLGFQTLLKPNFTFHFIDMFYHGRSQWYESSSPLTKNHWKQILQNFQHQEGFTDFHLIGYSMGGKFSLLTYELFFKQVKSLILLAPDGIKTGISYSMSSYPSYFHPLFKRVVFKPQGFFGIVEKLNTIGILESSLVKFVKTQMSTRSQRAQAYFTWRVYGNLQLKLSKITLQAQVLKTPMILFIGEHDRMITPKSLSSFIKKIPHLQSHSLAVGHGGLIEAAIEHLNQEESSPIF